MKGKTMVAAKKTTDVTDLNPTPTPAKEVQAVEPDYQPDTVFVSVPFNENHSDELAGR